MVYIVLAVFVLLGLSVWGLSSLAAFVATFFGGALVGALILGSVWFWFLVAAASCFILWSIDDAVGDGERYDSGRAAPFVLLLSLLALQVFGDVQVFSYTKQHPFYSFGWLVAYVALGVVYSFGRWLLLVRKRSRKFFEAKNAFFSHNDGQIVNNVIPEELSEIWKEKVGSLANKPMARAHKGRIIHWIAYWPWSAIWFVISDLVKDFFRELYEALHRWYQKISDTVWAGVERETQGITVTPPARNEEEVGEFLYPRKRR